MNTTKYMNTSLSVGERAQDLLSRMTLKEKIGQMNQKMHGWNAYKVEGETVELTEAFAEEVAFGDGVGAIYGVFRADGWNSHLTSGIKVRDSVRVANTIQRYIRENTRLGIPVFLSEECPHGHEALQATTFPTNIGIGASWNTELYEKVCNIIARELRARGGHLGLISALDIAMDPRWGRTEECYSEDPFLAAAFCEKAVLGMQGDKDALTQPDRVISVLKHFCAQGATIGGHNGKATNIGPRELFEIHLPGMKKGAKAGALGCMAAYNDIDGVPCHINRSLLTGILREQFGFTGFVMSDGRGVDRAKNITGSYESACAAAVHAGVDLNLWNECFLKLENAVRKNPLLEKDIDAAVLRILEAKFRMGLFENPYVEETPALLNIGSKEAKETALEIARESVVLLENKGDVLPLGKEIKRIAVIGPNGDSVYNQLGDYTQWKEEGEVVTVLQGLRKQAPSGVTIEFATGCGIRDVSKDGFPSAISLAEDADAVVMVLGGSSTREPGMTFEDNGAVFMNAFTKELNCGEAVDLAELRLGGVQEDLAKEIKKFGKPLIVVLIEGRPHAVSWMKENADALLCAWYPGERGGDAVGEILFGRTNPSGRLPVSIPKSSAQLPVYYNRKDETDYIDESAKPLYPFGYGQSYTEFVCGDFKLNTQRLSLKELEQGKRFEMTCSITNKGGRQGKEVLQLYIYDMESCITRRVKELKDFAKVSLEKGEERQVRLSVGDEELRIYDYDMNFVLEKGHVRLMLGKSSADILYDTIVEIVS
ncbi:MAG: glycoside hydrolase family 3 N-terminal domain-containing protein [Clostridium sp.]|uniref:glycoside hydrolase family 3 N-terminal domain-containing protein n=1 Tax=Clostridia TaxID=186801 RepID=UPI0001FC7D2B|nr:glycoside hydrolase family 3 N-terminal domain-containing protein [Clostridium sp. D5]EGB92389.1 beta-glucosidase [Clostridium sp. D5]MBS6762887.1 glycoside hydrolase family 3 C-terminal domain-containing protein [Clostridium sp.]MDU7708537.1 glycoside hydrolase family 3 N-terminal domain-containing protein [Clostridium sp.]MEE0201141.1 glycoside hydrolase family 3 N-terminal domain-containing protein [Muricomes sp.]